MTDKKELRNKVMLSLATSPVTLFPFVGGVTAFLLQWAFDFGNGPTMLISLTAALVSFGIFISRLLIGSEKITKQAIEELKQEAEEKRNEALDQLENKLCRDGDERTQTYLRDLRTLAASFKEEQFLSQGLVAMTTFEIMTGVEELFQGCVRSLERTLVLYESARKISSFEARQPLLEQRETIITNVRKSITQLGAILAGISQLGIGEGSDSEIQRIQAELSQTLEVARNVDARMKREFLGTDTEEFE